MLNIKALIFNPFGVNTYVVWNCATRDAAVIDPGMWDNVEEAAFDRFIAENGLHLTQLINTHMHVDHIFGDNYVKSVYKLPLAACTDDAFFGENAEAQCRMFHLPVKVKSVIIDRQLHDGDKIDVCGEEVTVLHMPGHSPGGIALYFPESKWLISGDSLFKSGIGRTDLVGGDETALIDSIKRKLFTLPHDTIVLAGHGPASTIGDEILHNPYVR